MILEVIKMTENSLKDLKTTIVIGGNQEASKKLTSSKETIIWEKLEVKSQTMTKMLITEQLFIDLNKFNFF